MVNVGLDIGYSSVKIRNDKKKIKFATDIHKIILKDD